MSSLEELELNQNEIEGIAENSFQNLFNLKGLYLNENKIRKLELSTFDGLTRLVRLELNENEINEIAENAFGKLVSLKGLYLNKNKLEKIEPHTFNGLSGLDVFQLGVNNLHSKEIVAKFVFDFSHIQCLVLDYDIFRDQCDKFGANLGLHFLSLRFVCVLYTGSSRFKPLTSHYHHPPFVDFLHPSIRFINCCHLKQLYYFGQVDNDFESDSYSVYIFKQFSTPKKKTTLKAIESEHFFFPYKLEVLWLHNNEIKIDKAAFRSLAS